MNPKPLKEVIRPTTIIEAPRLAHKLGVKLTIATEQISYPNGIQLSPDEKTAYASNGTAIAAFDVQDGVISPGGVGYDINCGMRLIRTDLTLADVQPYLEQLMTELFRRVPAGVEPSSLSRRMKPVRCASSGSGPPN